MEDQNAKTIEKLDRITRDLFVYDQCEDDLASPRHEIINSIRGEFGLPLLNMMEHDLPRSEEINNVRSAARYRKFEAAEQERSKNKWTI